MIHLAELHEPTGKDLHEARRAARLNLQQAADFIGCNRTTLGRQEMGISRVNLACFRLFLARGGLFPGAAALGGWAWDDAGLWSPEGVHFAPGEIRALPYLHALISEYERQLGIGKAAGKPRQVVPLPLPGRGIR